MLENTHPDGVALFAINKKLVNQFSLHLNARLAVNINGFAVFLVHGYLSYW
jgi:hydroxyacyl-ACP dehydratase HTD2-like protein with hotdog domain